MRTAQFAQPKNIFLLVESFGKYLQLHDVSKKAYGICFEDLIAGELSERFWEISQ